MGLFDGAISGGLGFIGGLINQGAQKKENRRQRQFAREQAENAWNKQVQMFNMTNAYNTPQAQVQRLKNAGLSPHLMYGNGGADNTASATSAPSMLNANTKAPQLDLAAIFQGMKMNQDIKLGQAMASKENALAALNLQKAKTETIETSIRGIKNLHDMFKYNKDKEFTPFQLEGLKLNNLQTGMNIKKILSTIMYNLQGIEQMKADVGLKEAQTSYYPQMAKESNQRISESAAREKKLNQEEKWLIGKFEEYLYHKVNIEKDNFFQRNVGYTTSAFRKWLDNLFGR